MYVCVCVGVGRHHIDCTRGVRARFEAFGLDQGSGFRVQGAGFRVQGAGFRIQGAGFRVQGSGFGVQGSGRWDHET